jgi:hypothetical protein
MYCHLDDELSSGLCNGKGQQRLLSLRPFPTIAQVRFLTTSSLFLSRELLRSFGKWPPEKLWRLLAPGQLTSMFRSFAESSSSRLAKASSRRLNDCSDGERFRFRNTFGISSSDSARDSEQVSAISSSRASDGFSIIYTLSALSREKSTLAAYSAV